MVLVRYRSWGLYLALDENYHLISAPSRRNVTLRTCAVDSGHRGKQRLLTQVYALFQEASARATESRKSLTTSVQLQYTNRPCKGQPRRSPRKRALMPAPNYSNICASSHGLSICIASDSGLQLASESSRGSRGEIRGTGCRFWTTS